jgi:uncharacterized protein YhaN
VKIRRLDLIAFGPFDNRTLDLGDGDGGLVVIYGDNEDGKSTTLRAVRSLLYGIGERPRDAYRFSDYSQLRVGGTLCRKSGEEISFIRRKTRKSPLLKAGTEEPLPDDTLEPFVGGVDEDEFSKRYGIDHAELVEGGRGIRDQTGDIGKALFSAATGTASIKRILEKLVSDASELFRPRAPKTRIYALLSEHAERAKEAKNSALPTAEWTKLRQERDSVAQQRSRQDEERRLLDQEKSKLERVRRVRPLLDKLDQMNDELAALGDVVDLPEDFEQLRGLALADKRKAGSDLQKIAAKRDPLEKAATVDLPTSVLERASAIALLGKKLGAYDQAQDDRPVQDAKRRQHINNVCERLKSIQPGLAIEKADSLRPLLALDRTVQQFASQYEKLATEDWQTQRDFERKKERLDRLQEELSKIFEQRDPKQLSVAIREAQRAGEVDDQIQEQTDKCEEIKSKCGLQLERLDLWKGSAEKLDRVPLPTEESVKHYEREFDKITKDLQTNAEKQRETEEHQRRVERQISTLVHGGQVPSVHDLQNARELRDEGWSLVRRHYIQKEKVEKDLRKYADQRALEDVYEEAVEQADEVADRLRSDADRVQKVEVLKEQVADQARKLNELREEERDLQAMEASLQGEWAEIWTTVGIDDPRSPKEMAAWLARVEKLRENLERLRVAERDRAALIQKRATSLKALKAQIEALGESTDGLATDDLRSVLDEAQELVERVKHGLARRQELTSGVQDAVGELRRAEEDAKEVQGRRARWQREWEAETREFTFLNDRSVPRVQTALEQLKALFADHDKADEVERRIYGIDKRIAEFEEEVDAFAESIGQPRGGQIFSQYVAGLNDSLTRAREIETQLKTVRKQQQDLDAEEIEARAMLGDAEARLAELRRQAKVENDDDLLAAGTRSNKMRELKSAIASQRELISQAGDSRSIDELRSGVQGIDVDTLDAQIAQKESAIVQLDEERSRTAEHEGALKSQVEATDGSAAAADASERAAMVLAQMRDEVRTYLKLRTATLILQNQIETYRQENQTPVLKRAGELFATLTLGSFKGLRDDVDDNDQPALKGVRPDNLEVGVEGMSDGARDQLYLALRLATLEHDLEKRESMPLIVDDILIGFDDARTEACLKVLADLAERMQVLVFTHHRRVAEIAMDLAKDRRIAVREI